LILHDTVKEIEGNITKESEEKQLEYDKMVDDRRQKSDDNETKENEPKENEPLPTHYHVRKPKLLKSTSKTHKLVQDMCFTVTDHLEEWLIEQEKLIKQLRQETKDNDKEIKIKFEGYCTGEYKELCDEASVDLNITYFKLKMKYTPRPPPPPPTEDIKQNETVNLTQTSNDTDNSSLVPPISDSHIHFEDQTSSLNKNSDNADQTKTDL